MDWQALWVWLSNPRNQQTLAWVGSGGAVIAAGVWAVIRFLISRNARPPNGPNVAGLTVRVEFDGVARDDVPSLVFQDSCTYDLYDRITNQRTTGVTRLGLGTGLHEAYIALSGNATRDLLLSMNIKEEGGAGREWYIRGVVYEPNTVRVKAFQKGGS